MQNPADIIKIFLFFQYYFTVCKLTEQKKSHKNFILLVVTNICTLFFDFSVDGHVFLMAIIFRSLYVTHAIATLAILPPPDNRLHTLPGIKSIKSLVEFGPPQNLL